ncbi:DUF58 domain-containing protein [Sutcliffiella horikoshii]|uniref:DUF58 domain-containing protein n=1 Tax=Sutcliffiella horikoshii TaxID=79883 RepID=UPI001F39BC11|nr:DUF58 domain-containing protein [Sutcliffiella horikoshii]MCG1021080.1 DUF58 domain-containing protein [Sutcliffiella horikoshii]
MLNSTLTKQLQTYTLQAGKLKRSWHKGTRKSTRYGASHDFSDYRMYEQGDDLRQVDWNIFARTQKHYIKRYLDEQELSASIYLDCTNSMASSPEKWKLAKTLAASFAYLGLSQDDRISIIDVHGEQPPYLYRKGKGHLFQMMQYVEEINAKESSLLFSEATLEHVQRKSSVSIVISDLMEPIDSVLHTLKIIQANRQQIYLLQVLEEDELNPSFDGDFMLIDSETNQEVNVTVSEFTRKNYKEKMQQRMEMLEGFCFERGISYLVCSTAEKVEDILFKRMTSKGWIR